MKTVRAPPLGEAINQGTTVVHSHLSSLVVGRYLTDGPETFVGQQQIACTENQNFHTYLLSFRAAKEHMDLKERRLPQRSQRFTEENQENLVLNLNRKRIFLLPFSAFLCVLCGKLLFLCQFCVLCAL